MKYIFTLYVGLKWFSAFDKYIGIDIQYNHDRRITYYIGIKKMKDIRYVKVKLYDIKIYLPCPH